MAAFAVIALCAQGLASPQGASPPPVSKQASLGSDKLAGTAVVAVLNIRGRGFSLQESSLLANLLRLRMEAADQFHVVSAARIKAVSDPQYGGFLDCADKNCAWRATAVLQADYAVIGKMSGEGREGEIEIDLIDAGSGEVIEKFSADVQEPWESPENEWIGKLSEKVVRCVVDRQHSGSPMPVRLIPRKGPTRESSIPGSDSKPQEVLAEDRAFHRDKRATVAIGIAGGGLAVVGAAMVALPVMVDYMGAAGGGAQRVPDRPDRLQRAGFFLVGAGVVVEGAAVVGAIVTTVQGVQLRNAEHRTGYRVTVVPVVAPLASGYGAVARVEF